MIVVLGRWLDVSLLEAPLEAVGAWAPLLLLAIWIVGTPLFVPGTLLCAIAGLALGPLGVVLSLLGSPLGALVAFTVARAFADGERLRLRLPARLVAIVARIERSGPWGVAAVRMAPALPVGAFNYACGLTRLSTRDFVIGSTLGAAPRIVLYGGLGGLAAALPFL